MRFDGKVALITGAGRGIGRAIAVAYAKEGAKLALAARTLSELEETARQAEASGAATCVIPCDVTDPQQVEAMVASTLDCYPTIDILVNNAGIVGPVGPLQDNDVSHWVQTIQLNVIGVFLCCRAVLPTMLARNSGKIVNMSGVGGRNLSAYGASKAALVDITETLYQELRGKNIQVNAMSPGSIHTAMWEETHAAAAAIGDEELLEWGERVTSGRGASMQRAADLAVFLASDEAGSMSGRLIQAVTDDFESLTPRVPDIMESDAFFRRRVELQ